MMSNIGAYVPKSAHLEPGHSRFYAGYDKVRPENLESVIAIGHCHHPVLPHGTLLLFARDAAIDLVDGCFCLINDPDQPDLAGRAVKFLRRAAGGGFELISNVGGKRLTARMTVVGVLVAAIRPAEDTQEALQLRELADRAVAEERARRAGVVADAVNRWGKPPLPPATRIQQ